MFCGGCFRDNALVAALRKLGHATTMLPLYLPLTLDEENQSEGTPIFFSGVNVYLAQKSAWFRNAPRWLHNLLSAESLLKLAARQAGKTNPRDLGELTVSMLRGEEGNQARELEPLIQWLKENEKPEVISLSNALLIGLARQLKRELKVPIVCSLQGEDYFLDSLAEPHRAEAWKTLSQRVADVDLFIAPSNYFGEVMSKRLGIPSERIRVIYNGINLEGYDETRNPELGTRNFLTLGYFARMCSEKGLQLLVSAFIGLKKRNEFKNLKLRIGGGCGPADEPFVEKMREQLRANDLLADVEFLPNLTRDQKIEFLKSLDVFCVPALYGEAFGLYVIEALAAGVPVVQPRHAAFPELIDATGGGLIAEPHAESLAENIGELLADSKRAKEHGETGRKVVFEKFSVEKMARDTANVFAQLAADFPIANPKSQI